MPEVGMKMGYWSPVGFGLGGFLVTSTPVG